MSSDQIEEEEVIQDIQVKLPTTANLEPLKSKFFTGDMEGFKTELTNGKFTAFMGKYNFDSDYDGSPQFVVKNLLNGFPRQLEDKRKYLFVAFRCVKNGSTSSYSITSVWVTNCTLPFNEVIPEKYDDFTWTPINLTGDLTSVMDLVMRSDDENVMTAYLH